MQSNNLILDLTFKFSIDVTTYCEKIYALKKFHISNQLFRAATAIGSNMREAQSPESKADFIHKCKVAHKEAEETKYWLELCAALPSYPAPEQLYPDVLAILRIIGKIISSSKGK
jgi:four helix bundle protein